MALEEVVFTNTNGEEISLTNLVNQMINYYELKQEVGETKITDFTEGSEIRNLLEAFAVGIYALLEEQNEATKIAFISTSSDEWLDKIGELPFINLPRIVGEYAHGTVAFTLAETQDTDIIIPEETIVACSDTGLDFYTTTECVISMGDLTADAEVECFTEGYDGNVLANTIDTIVSDTLNLELISVNNASALEEGADDEEDEEYRERLLANVRADGFGTYGWYQNLCESVKGVHDVLLIDDTNYTKKVLVNAIEKPTSDVLLLQVLTKLTDTNNKVLTHTFTVDKPTYTLKSLEITMDVVTEVDTSEMLMELTALFDGTISRHDYTGLNINESVTRDDIISVLKMFDDVSEVTSIIDNGEEVTVLTPAQNGVLQLGTVVFNQNEV